MARMKPVDIITKRDILHGTDTSHETLVSYGEGYFASGALHDALSYYMRASHEPGIRQVVETATKEGETFVLQRIERSHRVEVQPDAWRRVAESAERLGKLRYALTGFERAGDEVRANAIRVKLGIAETHKVLPGTEVIDPAASTTT